MQDLKILFLQQNLVWENPEQNRANFSNVIEKSFSDEHIVVLPETFTTGFPVDPVLFAENINGKTTEWLAKTAKHFNTVIIGSFLVDNDGYYTNTLVVMHQNGNFERYDKRHVFSMGGEHERIKPGNKQLILNINGWKIKPMICYDLRFPVWSKNRCINGDYEYDLAIYVANWPAVRSFPWRQLLIARAIENLAYVVGVNRIGTDGFGNKYSGNSMAVDFKGKVISECETSLETVCKTTFFADELKDFRKKFNVCPDWDNFEIKL